MFARSPRWPGVALAALVLTALGALGAGSVSAGAARQPWAVASALDAHRDVAVAAAVTTKHPKKHHHKKKKHPTPSTAKATTPTKAATPTKATPTKAAPVSPFSLMRTYTFTGSTLDPDWAVYDTSYGSDPDARVRSLVTVSGGALHVATTGAKGSGLCLCRGNGKPSTPYGRWDIRARAGLSADHGFAMLLWPNAENWPVGGEIDIAEFPGATRSTLQTTVHYGPTNRHTTTFTPGSYAAWHTYSVIWTKAAITYLVDGRRVMTVTDPAKIPTGAMHLALQAGMNTGVGAANASPATSSLDVAWVKIYR